MKTVRKTRLLNIQMTSDITNTVIKTIRKKFDREYANEESLRQKGTNKSDEQTKNEEKKHFCIMEQNRSS